MVAGVACATIAALVACFAPTEVKIELTTDVACRSTPFKAPRTVVYLGPKLDGADDIANTLACAKNERGSGNEIGSLVIVPRDARDTEVTVHVVMNVDGGGTAECRAGGAPSKSCIIARRRFRFIEHKARTIPIRLDSSCLGIRCDDDKTCQNGECVSAFVPDDEGEPCPTCGSPVPDASKTDGAVADADKESGDASGELCSGIGDGVVVPAIGAAVDAIAVNSQQVYWASIQPTMSRLFAAPKTGASSPGPSFFDTPSRVGAIAADDKYLWVGTNAGLLRFDVGDLTAEPKVFDGAEIISDISLYAGTTYYLAAPIAAFAPRQIKKVVADTASVVTSATMESRYLAVTKTRFWVLDTTTQQVIRIDASTFAKDLYGVDTAFHIAAFDGTTTAPAAAFVTRRTPSLLNPDIMSRVEATGVPPLGLNYLHAAPDPTRVAVDGTSVFHIRNTPDDAVVVRSGIGTPNASGEDEEVPQAIEKRRYQSIKGLVIDPAGNGCVYFSANPPGPPGPAPNFSIRAAPKGAVGTSVDAGTKGGGIDGAAPL